MGVAFADDAVVSIDAEVVANEVGAGVILLDLRTSKFFQLNSVGSFVWQQLKSPRSIAQIHAAVCAEFAVEPERCSADIHRLIEKLRDAGLVRVDASPQ